MEITPKAAHISDKVRVAGTESAAARPAFGGLRLQCPACRKGETQFEGRSGLGWRCPECGFYLADRDGVFLALPPERKSYYAKFIEEYLTIRRDEGRGSTDPSYYLSLPYEDRTGRLAEQWAMRGKSYRFFEQKILPAMERESPAGLDVLDLGAGTGWLSYRLALRRHRAVAVDLLTDSLDGLGAAQHYFAALGYEFPAFQAEFDRLPFADTQFDLVVFNSSFHYSTDYRQTLQEARRCLRWPGRVVIIDSPVYKRWQDGEQMREERHRQFEARYGFRSDRIPSMEFLDEATFDRLSAEVNVHWTVYRPWYGWRWHSRPVKAKLAGRRAPSRFWILVGTWQQP